MKGLLIASAFLSALLVGCASSESAATPSTFVTLTTLSTPAPSTTTEPTSTTSTLPPDTVPPRIETTPEHGDKVRWFRGDIVITTEPGSMVTINGAPVDVATDGTYVFPVTNALGINVVDVSASDAAGNVTTTEVKYEFVPEGGWIAAIGDSVMLGSKEEIEKRLEPGIIDATVSRQFLDAPGLVRKLMAGAPVPQVIIIGLGTNGPVQVRHLDEVMEIAGTEPLIAFVNVHVPRKWETTSNDQLAAGVDRYDNAVLVDWYGATEGRDDLFARDGFHPKQPGRVIMADLISAAIFPDRDSETGG